jgi:Protein of unknown function (DUF1592)/Protein of unknown function (DUF1587)/Protein of unknown function (DUF1595)/Planctomycete cytochrome C
MLAGAKKERFLMGSMLWRGWFAFAAFALLHGPARADVDFSRDVLPILQAHCIKCHGNEKQKGGLDLHRHLDPAHIVSDLKTWQTVNEVIAQGQMPPRNQPPLDEKQRQLIAGWVNGVVRQVESAVPTDPGPTLPRRVTRREYRNMIRDLFNVEIDVETYLPESHSASGYDNQVAQLAVPPELFEKYLLLAEHVVDHAFPNIYNTRQKEPIKSWFLGWEGEKGLKARAAAEQNLRQLARLAFRRPAEEKEIATLMKLFDRAFAEKIGFHESLRYSVKGMLVLPQFLFRVESLPPDQTVTAVNDQELGSRLSFFLWSSLPDQELLNLAATGELHRPDTLRRQVKRMLKDPKIGGQSHGVHNLADYFFSCGSPRKSDRAVRRALNGCRRHHRKHWRWWCRHGLRDDHIDRDLPSRQVHCDPICRDVGLLPIVCIGQGCIAFQCHKRPFPARPCHPIRNRLHRTCAHAILAAGKMNPRPLERDLDRIGAVDEQRHPLAQRPSAFGRLEL